MKIIVALALLLALLAAACGVPADSSPQLLDESALPPELADPSTTTMTTEPPAASVDQLVYFFDDEDFLADASREVSAPVDPQDLLEVLFVGPTEEEADQESLRSAIPLETEIIEITQTGDVLTPTSAGLDGEIRSVVAHDGAWIGFALVDAAAESAEHSSGLSAELTSLIS